MMAQPESATSLQERLRLRELSKYYCATSPSPLPDLRLRGGTDEDDQSYFDPVNYQPTPPRLSTDSNLNGLVQLAAFRLGCDRALVSIIDNKFQYVLAEATRTISLFDENKHEPGDELLLGAQSLPVNYGICPKTIGVFNGVDSLDLTHPSAIANESCVMIPDVLAEKAVCEAPALKALPRSIRFYLEVPLKTDTGFVVGSLCAIHSRVREPDPSDVSVLQEMAKTIIQHLEWSRMKEDHRRAERLLEGLSHFVKGKDSISDWSKRTEGQAEIPNAYPEPSKLSSTRLTQTPYEEKIRNTSVASTASTDSASRTTSPAQSSEEPPATTITPATSIAPPPPASRSEGTDIEVGYDALPVHAPADEFQPAVVASISVRQAFSRAANLIREGMDLDASCFLEIPQNERFRNMRQRPPQAKKDSVNSSSLSHSSTDSSTDSSSDTTPRDNSRNHIDAYASGAKDQCHRLGFSTRAKSSLAGSTTGNAFLTLPANLLTKLADKYPDGYIFHFDTSGSVSSGDDSQDKKTKAHTPKNRKERLSERLFKLFPSARSLIFLPLYDNDKQQVYAGYLGWTTNPARALQKHEVVYVSAFANSLMCEVMRLEALATDKAKSDFISSISHELRSPLHGILAASQLLSESDKYPKQAEFLQMIDQCARTLLDIMNHLLDHAKINNFTRKENQKRPKLTPRVSQSPTYSLVTRLNLLSIVEETAASMAASSNQMLRQTGRGVAGSTSRCATGSNEGPSRRITVPIILNVAHCEHWNFNTEAGSWRRIIMNLIGNSLKYTQRGHINVQLSLRDNPQRSGCYAAELKISDTGQGMSEEYLRHRLYTPFAQENNLSVGAGLGLSLVKKIVSTLRGGIHVRSEVGSGTEITVTVPLEMSGKCQDAQVLTEIDDSTLLALTKGRSVQFLGFDHRPTMHEHSTGIPDPHTNAAIVMKDSMARTMVDWFGLTVVDDHGDICVIEESFLEGEMETYDHTDNNLLVVGLDGRSTTTDRINHANYVYMLPPVGPIRMAQTLRTLLEAKKDRASDSDNQPEATSPGTGKHARPGLQSRGRFADKSPTSHSQTQSFPANRSNSTRIEARRPLHSSSNGSDSSTSSGRRTGGEAVLLVDDNDINLRILTTCVARLQVKDSGISYLTATNGQEALEKYKHAVENGTRISVVFMDISMPIMNGFTSTREIRTYEKGKGMRREIRSKIIALTGLASAEAQNEVESSGFDMYLRKPVSLKTIRDVLMDERVKALPEGDSEA